VSWRSLVDVGVEEDVVVIVVVVIATIVGVVVGTSNKQIKHRSCSACRTTTALAASHRAANSPNTTVFAIVAIVAIVAAVGAVGVVCYLNCPRSPPVEGHSRRSVRRVAQDRVFAQRTPRRVVDEPLIHTHRVVEMAAAECAHPFSVRKVIEADSARVVLWALPTRTSIPTLIKVMRALVRCVQLMIEPYARIYMHRFRHERHASGRYHNALLVILTYSGKNTTTLTYVARQKQEHTHLLSAANTRAHSLALSHDDAWWRGDADCGKETRVRVRYSVAGGDILVRVRVSMFVKRVGVQHSRRDLEPVLEKVHDGSPHLLDLLFRGPSRGHVRSVVLSLNLKPVCYEIVADFERYARHGLGVSECVYVCVGGDMGHESV
jgi:hypothetical protein